MSDAQVKKHIPRIVTFDIMRGFFLIAIINDHLHFFPNFFDWWGMRGLLVASTAEGFFLLSGIVLGIVRGAKLVDVPFSQVTKIVLKRALTLYITYIVLVIAFTLIGWYIFSGNPHIKYGIMEGRNWLELIWQSATFQYTYGWADYLRFYAIYLALSPLALWLLRRGLWYIVLLCSAFIWLAFPLDHKAIPWQELALLQPIPWQVLFFSGLVIGFHWPDITSFFVKNKKAITKYVVPVILITGISTFVLTVFAVFSHEFIQNSWTSELSSKVWELRNNTFKKETLPIARYAIFMLWFWTSFIIVRHFEKPILKYTGWLLVPFGTNSLYVYTLHAIILYFVLIYFTPTNVFVNFLVFAAIVAVIYFAIKKKFLFNIIPR